MEVNADFPTRGQLAEKFDHAAAASPTQKRHWHCRLEEVRRRSAAALHAKELNTEKIGKNKRIGSDDGKATCAQHQVILSSGRVSRALMRHIPKSRGSSFSPARIWRCGGTVLVVIVGERDDPVVKTHDHLCASKTITRVDKDVERNDPGVERRITKNDAAAVR